MLGRLLRPRGEERHVPHVVYAPNGWGWVSGSSSMDELRSDAVWACLDVLASSISSLPVDAIRIVGGSRQPVTPTPLLLTAPSALVDPDVWLYQLAGSMITDGNAFGMVVAVDGAARPTVIEPIDPLTVKDRRVVEGVPQAKVDGTVEKLYPFGDLWHVPGKMVRAGSPFALSPVEHAAKTIAAGLSAEEFGHRFFTDGGHPSSILYLDSDPGPDQAAALKRSYMNATRGNREPAVFGAGVKHEKVSVDPNDSQFIELQRFTVEKVCRFFRVPPAMVYAAMSGQSVTYANVSQQDLHYLKHSLDGYLVRIENALTKLLPRPQVVKFNRNALLRADAATRYASYEVALRNRWMSVNEVRALEDLAPFADAEFNKPGVPPWTTPADVIAELAAPQEQKSRMVQHIERDEFGRPVRVISEPAP